MASLLELDSLVSCELRAAGRIAPVRDPTKSKNGFKKETDSGYLQKGETH